MKVDLTKHDLVHLVIGIQPSKRCINNLKSLDIFHYYLNVRDWGADLKRRIKPDKPIKPRVVYHHDFGDESTEGFYTDIGNNK